MNKTVKITKVDGLRQTLNIKISSEIYKNYFENIAKDYKNKVKLDGFRSGKVPESVIKKKYNSNIHSDSVSMIVEKSFSEALMENKLVNVSPPKIVIKSNPSFEQPLEFDAEFEIMPNFKIEGLDKLSIEEVQVDITDKDIDEVILNIQKQHIKWDESTEAAAPQDKIIIDYVAKIDDKEIEDLKRENFTFIIGDNIKGDESTVLLFQKFYEVVKGKSKGNDINFPFTLPSSFMNKDVAGREVKFFANIKHIYKGNLPELDKNFYSKFGLVDGSDEDFKNAVKVHMESELANRKKSNSYANINDQLLSLVNIDIPKYLLEKERHSISDQYKSFMKDIDENTNKELDAIASKRVKLNLIYMKLADDNNLLPSNADVESYITKNYPPDQRSSVIKSKDKDKVFSEIKNKILEDGIMNFVISKGKKITIKKNFSDVVN